MRVRVSLGCFLFAAGLAAVSPAVSAAPLPGFAVVELFTSEGCSSCPPAEAWLSRLKDSPGLWKDFVPVAFHVEYWDHLGWRDPWASKRFSERQRDYAQAWNSDTIYTPEVVLNGREWRGWAGHVNVPGPNGIGGALAVNSTNASRWTIVFTPSLASGNYELHAALLASGLNSHVKAGENRGRRLEHDFVVVSFVEKLMKRQDGELRDEFVLKPESPTEGSRLALAAWVTRAGSPIPLQATGGWLPASGR